MVYCAERVDGEVRQRAAVKLLHPGWTDAHRERFLQEREILAALSHPNIAHLLDAGHLERWPTVSGDGVCRREADRPALRGARRAAKDRTVPEGMRRGGVSAQESPVHRDLKPSNILVTADGEPKLLDFGISKVLDVGGDVTATNLRMLTPKYASPEQASGRPVGRASDIYSLGAVLHTIVTGAPPQGDAAGLPRPGLKGDLDLVVRTALRREPEERYASVEAVRRRPQGRPRCEARFAPVRAM